MIRETAHGGKTEVETLFYGPVLTSAGGHHIYRELKEGNRALKQSIRLHGEVNTQLTSILEQGLYTQPRMQDKIEHFYGLSPLPTDQTNDDS